MALNLPKSILGRSSHEATTSGQQRPLLKEGPHQRNEKGSDASAAYLFGDLKPLEEDQADETSEDKGP